VNEALTVKFIEKMVPKLERDEVLVALLAARKKYSPVLSKSHEVVARELIRDCTLEHVLQKIRKISVVGHYLDAGKIIPTDAFALYIDLNPKSVIRAVAPFFKEVNALLYQAMVTGTPDYNTIKRIDMKLFSCIHTSNSARPPYWDLDIDEKDYALLEKTVAYVGEENVSWIIESHGGFHIIVPRTQTTGIRIFKCGLPAPLKTKVSVEKEVTVPVPGTLQGGFMVREVRL
jgi:hypothetical protein